MAFELAVIFTLLSFKWADPITSWRKYKKRWWLFNHLNEVSSYMYFFNLHPPKTRSKFTRITLLTEKGHFWPDAFLLRIHCIISCIHHDVLSSSTPFFQFWFVLFIIGSILTHLGLWCNSNGLGPMKVNWRNWTETVLNHFSLILFCFFLVLII